MSKARRIAIVATLLIATGAGFLSGVYQKYLAPIHEYITYRDRIIAMLNTVRETPPAGTSARSWETLCNTAVTGVYNAIYFPSHTSNSETIRLEADLRRRLEQTAEPDVETIVWFWDRMGECSYPARRHTLRARWMLDEIVDARQRSGQAQVNAGAQRMP